MAMTSNGIPCQAWNSQTPNEHGNTPSKKPHSGLIKNYCRNPDNEKYGPWCYTSNGSYRWRYCYVKECFEKGKVAIFNSLEFF